MLYSFHPIIFQNFCRFSRHFALWINREELTNWFTRNLVKKYINVAVGRNIVAAVEYKIIL